ncbi:hypothetical protein FNF29_00878 [Cafeteria roenbergensis]|uniref:Uncharacterized protein n=1 Tax=Cafeteria roenbergensis TaxID=33653 RepID=A0A5A8CWI4_CAFRO|nr:hypothetical protein FNF29_00878 [Cafeteria roenbergensis]|eukprot:KAA0156767.1 hypothetical protein FNF29_00878 [Cafeteria roenbergensis]
MATARAADKEEVQLLDMLKAHRRVCLARAVRRPVADEAYRTLLRLSMDSDRDWWGKIDAERARLEAEGRREGSERAAASRRTTRARMAASAQLTRASSFPATKDGPRGQHVGSSKQWPDVEPRASDPPAGAGRRQLAASLRTGALFSPGPAPPSPPGHDRAGAPASGPLEGIRRGT